MKTVNDNFNDERISTFDEDLRETYQAIRRQVSKIYKLINQHADIRIISVEQDKLRELHVRLDCAMRAVITETELDASLSARQDYCRF